jgi:hypothetical protein
MNYVEVYHGGDDAIPMLHPIDVEQVYGFSASQYRCLHWHVPSYGSHYVRYSSEVNPMEGRLTLWCEVCAIEADQRVCRSICNDRNAPHFSECAQSWPELIPSYIGGQRNGCYSWGCDFLNHTIPWGVSEVCKKWIQCETQIIVRYQMQDTSARQSLPCYKSLKIWSIFIWSIWCIQQWWRILNTERCALNDTWAQGCCTTLTNSTNAPFELAVWTVHKLWERLSEL